jgi:Prion-inhibition and propagation
MPAKFQHLRTRLRIEQARLLNWGENIGLLKELMDKPSQTLQLNRNLILDILVEVQAAFRACVKIESKFDAVMAQKPTATKAKAPSGKTQPRSFLQRTLDVLENPSRLSVQLQWAMIKQDNFEGLIVKLIGYNDAVESILDKDAMHDLRIMQQQNTLAMLQLTEQVSELRTLSAAMYIRMEGGKVPPTSGISRSSTLVEENMADDSIVTSLASFKAQLLSIDQSEATSSELLILPRDLALQSDNDSPVLLKEYKGKKVWVEWREPVEGLNLHSELAKMIEQRVRKLAMLLGQSLKPKEFRAPHCLGYVSDGDEGEIPRYGFVFEVPVQISSIEPRMSNLRDLFTSTSSPSLTKRIALARMVTESLFYLHAVNLLHKGIRSKVILFFTEGGKTKVDLSSPVVSGFDFSRPDLPDEITVRHASSIEHDLYRHPDLLDSSAIRSCKAHDIYSLGIVLVEIAYWKPIEEIMDVAIYKKGARTKVRKLKSKILDEQEGILDEIENRTGEIFVSIVRRCIEGGSAIGISTGSNEKDPSTGAHMQQVFYEDILSQLQKLAI